MQNFTHHLQQRLAVGIGWGWLVGFFLRVSLLEATPGLAWCYQLQKSSVPRRGVVNKAEKCAPADV